MSKQVFGTYELSKMVLGFRRVQNNDDLQYCTRSKGRIYIFVHRNNCTSNPNDIIIVVYTTLK